MIDQAIYNQARKWIEDSDAVLITAGAGMGVDSGLPDFRGKEGFWKAYPIAKQLGLSFEEMANPIWFRKNPKLAWAFYGHRLNLYKKTVPHAGFSMLLDLVKEKTTTISSSPPMSMDSFKKPGSIRKRSTKYTEVSTNFNVSITVKMIYGKRMSQR